MVRIGPLEFRDGAVPALLSRGTPIPGRLGAMDSLLQRQ